MSAIDPLQQFAIVRLSPLNIGRLDLSFTNSALAILAAVALTSLLFFYALRAATPIPRRMQAAVELMYDFVFDTAKSALGRADAEKFIPLLFTLFLFVLGCNFIGMLPYSFTPTAHLAVTGAMALTIFVGVTLFGFYKNGLSYLRLFAPKGLPVFMLILVIPIEVIIYFARPLTHSMRLFANMMAGHVMVKLLGFFAVMMGPVAGVLPLAIMVPVTALEILVSFLQAYIFVTMTCVYLSDALHPEH